MLRRLSVRGKILATLAVPIIVLIAAAAIIAVQSVTAALDGRQYQQLARTTPAHDELMAALQNEYTVTLQRAAGEAVSDADISAARSTTDTLRSQYLSESEGINFGRFPLAVRVGWERSRTGIEGLDRALVDEFLGTASETNPTPTVVATYSSVIDSQENFYQAVTDSISDRNVAGYLALYANAFDLRSAYLTELRQVTPVIEQRETITSDDVTARNATVAIQDYQTAEAQTQASLANLAITDIALPEMASDQVAARDRIRAGNPEALTSQQATVWGTATADYDAKLVQFQEQVRERLISEVSNMASTAQAQALLTVAIAIAAVILSLVIALLIIRRIVNPLSHLTAAAKDVRDKLPSLVEQVAVPGTTPDLVIEPIPVESDDEIGQLAAAFNDVNETTVEVAQEQAALRGSIAEMFVNVARRDHALLNRQLSFLDELERTEEDPTVLSNLFRLDHLATRMRRNSESLLVLAGIDSGRRVRQSMALSDVVRTASSEIEAYDRVSLTLLEDPEMLGHYALYAAHLMAELLENATMFSDPSQQVEVTTNADRHYVSVAIRDFGLGMTDEELAEAQMKVQSRQASDTVGAQRLGLFVVGRLAEKLDASVDFQMAPGGGTLVVIAYPRSLFAEQTESDLDDEPIKAVAPVQRTAEEITSSDAWVPPAPVDEVDLAALTDGTTATGMPKRRTEGADSSSSDLDEDQIVLPALAQPDVAGLPTTNAADDDAWQPLGGAIFPETSGGLPARGGGGLPVRAAAAPVTPEVEEPDVAAVPVDTERRSAMFSSFRSTDDLAAAAGDTPADEAQADAPDEAVTGLESAPVGDEPDAEVASRSSMFSSFRPSGVAEAPPVADEPVPWTPQPAALPEDDDLWTPPTFDDEAFAGQAAPAEEVWTPPTVDDEAFAGQAAPAEEVWTPPTVDDEVAQPLVEEPAEFAADPQVADDSVWTAPTYSDTADTESWVNAGADAEVATVDEAVDGDTRLVLPRHAAPEDLERMMREYGGPEGLSAALTGPLPVVEESLVEDPNYLDALAAQQEVAGAEDSSIEPAPAVESEPDEVWQPTPIQDAYPDIPQLEFEDEDDFLADDTIMVARPGVAPAFGTSEIPVEAPQEVAAENVAEEPVFEQAAPEQAAPEQAAPEQAPTWPQTPAAGPTFPGLGTTSAPTETPVSEDTTPEPAKKKGIFSKVFGGKKKDKGAEAESAAPAFVPAAEPAPAPVATNSWASAAPTPAPAPAAPAVTESFTPVPAQAPSAAVESGVARGAAAAPEEPAGFNEVATFTPQPSSEQQGWSPNVIDFSSSDTPRSMSPELAAMLASRADLQDQALAELSQLSTYRPQQVKPEAAEGLVKRQKTEPVTEPVADDPTKQRITRDASVLRSRLAAFQSGTSRGREARVDVNDSDPSTEGDSHDAS